jgi:hypothetical protein
LTPGGRARSTQTKSEKGAVIMPRFRIQDVHTVEHAPTSPAALRTKVSEMIVSSTICRAKIEALNPETGEYRVVLQGTLDREDNKWE